MDKRLLLLVSVFFLLFASFASVVIFQDSLSRFIRAEGELTVSPQSSLMFAYPLSIPADGKTASTVSVFIRNPDGKPIPNKLISVTSTSGNISPPSTISDADGKGVFQITSGQIGQADISATVDSQTITQKVTVQFQ